MALTFKLLGADIVTTATTTSLYTVPSSSLGAVVSNVRLVNTGGGNATVNLYFTPNGGSQVRILDKDKVISSNDWVIVKPELTMGPSDKIELVTTGSPSIEWVVSGMEKA